jgi:hypothetical protein
MCILPTVISVFGLPFAPARLWNWRTSPSVTNSNVLKRSVNHQPRLTSQATMPGMKACATESLLGLYEDRSRPLRVVFAVANQRGA